MTRLLESAKVPFANIVYIYPLQKPCGVTIASSYHNGAVSLMIYPKPPGRVVAGLRVMPKSI